MRLVDGEQRDRRPRQLGEEALVVEPLGGDVEELQAAGAEAVGDVARLGVLEARVEPRRVDALADEGVDLILHQRDQRRDDDRDAVEQQRRQLVAEALAGAGREHRERRAAGEQRLDDALLTGPEGVEAEPGLEHLAGRGCLCFHIRQRSRAGGHHSERAGSDSRRRVPDGWPSGDPQASSQILYVRLIAFSSRRRWMRAMILSILLTGILTAILVCPLLAMSAIHRP